MHFSLVDSVLELTDDRIVTIKHVSSAEEYLQDHFPGFPVLPGVMMIESLVQAARSLLELRLPHAFPDRMVLASVRALKYGSFVRPGQTLRVDVAVIKHLDDRAVEFRGQGSVLSTPPVPGLEPATAVSGRFTLRPVRAGRSPVNGYTPPV